MSGTIIKVLEGWINVFDQIERAILNIANATERLAGHVATVPEKLDEIEARICADDKCLGPVIAMFSGQR